MLRINTGAEGLPIIPPDKKPSDRVEKIDKSRGKIIDPRKQPDDTFELSPEAEKKLEKDEDKIRPENE